MRREVLRSLSSWNSGGGAYDNSTYRKTGKGKSIPKRQRPTEVNTVLAFAGGDSTAPTQNPKSETMTSALHDAELIKDLRGLDKPPLFDGNDTDASFFTVSGDDPILLRHMDDVVDTSPDKCHRHRAIGEMANPRNQHIEMPHIQYTDKVADESVAVQRQVSPRTTETKAPEHQWDDRSGGDAVNSTPHTSPFSHSQRALVMTTLAQGSSVCARHPIHVMRLSDCLFSLRPSTCSLHCLSLSSTSSSS